MIAEPPRVTTTVGGRELIASGIIVLTRMDFAAVVTLDDLTFNFAFVPDEGAVNADVQLIAPNALRIRFTGTLPDSAISYELGHVGHWQNYALTLAVMIHAVNDPQFVVRQLAYTITGTELDLEQLMALRDGVRP